MSRKQRNLSSEERRLWDRVRQTAVPLGDGREAATSEEPDLSSTNTADLPPPAATKSMGNPSSPPKRFDHRIRSRLSRGVIDVDARLDLHGLTQNAAHQRLRRFLEDAQIAGVRLVLVITGKGRLGERADFGSPERGVLRHAVPQWLDSAAFRHLVAGYDVASRRHGGGGAIYIHVRRKRVER